MEIRGFFVKWNVIKDIGLLCREVEKMNKHDFVSKMIQETQGDYRKMVAYCKEYKRKPPKIIATSPCKMGCLKFEGQKFLWYYEEDLYGLMPLVRVDKAY
jgi:hypothetical protein